VSTPDPGVVIDLIEAFRRSKAMFTAVSLGIFDCLSERRMSAGELASATGANAGALERLLDGCVGLRLLEKHGGEYANTAVAEAWLRRRADRTLAGYILYSDQALYPMWAHLQDAVREASPRWAQTFGRQADIFAHFYRTDEAMRDFLLGMHGFGLLSSPRVVRAFDLSRFRRLVDLGGATGHLAMEARRRWANLECAVFDLPRVIEVAKEFGAREGVAVEYIAGDFFSDPLPPADLYSLGRILHDWSDEKAVTLLRKVHEALPTGGAVLIAEILLDDDRSGPVTGLMQSLNMLICTEGRERTLPEFAALLSAAGFDDVQGARTGAPLDAVLARKGSHKGSGVSPQ
jgi:acetylserotonin N-methyltransferase